MELIKITGGILIVISGTLIGLYASLRFRDRVAFTEQYLLFLNSVQTSVGYTGTEVKELLGSRLSVPLLRPVLCDTRKMLENGETLEGAWRCAVDIHVKDKSDRDMLYYFGDNFGTSSISGELNKLSLHSELVRQRLEALKEELKTKRRLYRIIGMFCGVLTAVLLI